jgi:hypothetical protein
MKIVFVLHLVYQVKVTLVLFSLNFLLIFLVHNQTFVQIVLNFTLLVRLIIDVANDF